MTFEVEQVQWEVSRAGNIAQYSLKHLTGAADGDRTLCGIVIPYDKNHGSESSRRYCPRCYRKAVRLDAVLEGDPIELPTRTT